MQETTTVNNFDKQKKYVEPILIVLTLFVMFFVYSYNLSDPQFGLWPDEASIGFNAYCISQNLHDAYNNLLPVYFKYQDGMIYRPPVYIYLSAIIIKIFGFSLYTTKILGIVCALFASMFTYLICRKAFNIYVAVIALFFLLMSPGYFHIHRFAYELTTFGCFASGFVYFVITAIEKKSVKWGSLAFIFFVLAWFSYMPSRIYLLSAIIISGLFFYKSILSFIKSNIKQKWSYYLLFFSLFIIFIVIPDSISYKTVSSSMYTEHAMLFNKDLAFINEHLFGRMPYAQEFFQDSPLLLKKLVYAGYNYLATYSPDFLFFNADNHPLNLAIGFGFLAYAGIVLVPLGLIASIFNIKKLQYRILLIFIFCIGVPSLLLWTVPDGTHNSSFYIPFSILAGTGGYLLISAFSRFKNIWLMPVLTFLLIIPLVANYIIYFNTYHGSYKIKNDHVLLTRRNEILNYVRDNRNKYQNIYISPQIWLIEDHILFYGALDRSYNVEEYQKNKRYPYGIKLLMQELYVPRISSDNIRDFYGDKTLLILNSAQLRGHEAESVRIFMYGNGEIFARAYAF